MDVTLTTVPQTYHLNNCLVRVQIDPKSSQIKNKAKKSLINQLQIHKTIDLELKNKEAPN